MKITLNIENKLNYQIPAQKEIEPVILDVLKEKGLDGNFEIDLKFVDKNEVQALNKKYRQINKPTDVLSFPIHTKDVILSAARDLSEAPVLLGDIIICPEMAADVKPVDIEKLIEHSTLHLLGFHHPDD